MCAEAIHDGLTANSNGARFQFQSSPDARGYAPMDAVIEDTDLDIAVRFTYLIVKQQAWSGPDARGCAACCAGDLADCGLFWLSCCPDCCRLCWACCRLCWAF